MKSKKWIQKALRHHKKGSLSRQLGIPEEDNIPISLLNEIIDKKAGQTVYYKSKRIKVTRLLERRAILARNLKRINN